MPGKIISITSDIIEVQFPKNELPKVGHILKDTQGSFFSVENILSPTTMKTIILKNNNALEINSKVQNTKKFLKAPIGKEALGRLFDLFGNAIDQKELPKTLKYQEVQINKKVQKVFNVKTQILETGIKVIDFFVPIFKGNKIGIFGGAGVGKTMIVKELINNTTKLKDFEKAVSIMVGIGERSREGEELYRELKESKLLESVILFYAQMKETAGSRMKIIYPAITSAEYFRDEQKKDVVVFVDNIYRFVQAGSEVSASLGKLPSESGYQATLASEISNVQERLSNSEHGTITSFQTVFIPVDDISDPSTVAVFSHLDGSLVLDRKIASANRYPAIDPLRSSSNNANLETIGKRHFEALAKTKKFLQKYEELEDVLAVLGSDGISSEDLKMVQRARKLQNFFTQNFFIAEQHTQRKGEFVSLKETISSIEHILNGHLDEIDDSEFLYISNVEHLLEKVAKLAIENKQQEKVLTRKEKKALRKKIK